MATTMPAPAASRAVAVLFTATAFVGAALLFVVQPMVAKLVLPSYGGSATVWSTSSLFFQVLLLVAYLYVHLSAHWLGVRWQPRAHLPLLVLPALVLPLALPSDAAPTSSESPALWLLRTLLLMVGLPFAVLATTGPVLQKWYSWTDSERADDPYFLFAASNFGSFGGLLAYPFLIEPFLGLDAQRTVWSIGFVVFALLAASCGVVASRGSSHLHREPPLRGAPIGWRRMLLWTGLSALPASLSLAVTAHLSTDVGAIPLLWVIPLAIYLATFTLAFARTTREPPVRSLRAAVAATLVVAVLTQVSGAPLYLAVIANLIMLGLVAFAAHARLAADRPPSSNLTVYYLVIATGGALGGFLNGIVAPMAFDRVWEFPLSVVLVPALLLGVAKPSFPVRAQLRTILLVLGGVILVVLLHRFGWTITDGGLGVLVLSLLVLAVGWALSRVPGVLWLLLVAPFVANLVANSTVVQHTRSFYSAYEIKDDGHLRQLIHGTTMHGLQFDDPARAGTATSYYASPGSVGDVFDLLGSSARDVGVVGLGVGTVAAYGQPGQRMTFFEIDQQMIDTARNTRLFTFLKNSRAAIDTVVGDGRLELEKQPDRSYDLLVLDAFSSDSIPAHLLTKEAFALYADKLRPGGVLAVHISNRLFDLKPVLRAAAEELGWDAVKGTSSGRNPGSVPSDWVVLSANPEPVSTLAEKPEWKPLGSGREIRWTDSYSSSLALLR